MNSFSRAACGSLWIFITSCAATRIPPYRLEPGIPSAEFSMSVDTDSIHTTTVSWQALAHANLSCSRSKYGVDLVSKLVIARPTPPARIEADKPFAFSAAYGETGFGIEKDCLITASFTPLSRHRYEAALRVSDQVARCELAIIDVTSSSRQAVDFDLPEKNCAGQPNGKPTWVRHEIHVTPAPH